LMSTRTRADRPATGAAAWRAQALAQIQDIRTQLAWMASESAEPGASAIAEAAHTQLDDAERVVMSRGSTLSLLTGSNVQAVQDYLDAATLNLLRLSPPWHLQSLLPNLIVEARRHLATADPRLQVLGRIEDKYKAGGQLDRDDRFAIVAAVQGSNLAAHREQVRVRSFRNVILGVTAVVASVAIVVAAVGFISPTTFPLCFAPESEGLIVVACPLASSNAFPTEGVQINDIISETVASTDIAIVLFLGALGATIAAASGLQELRASADPFSLGVALALLKLPTGALTAFLGLLLIRASVIPGLSALDSSAQIIAWAIILGYSQQLFTRYVDRQAQTVLQQADRPTGLLGAF
jgi:hypothetical protein